MGSGMCYFPRQRTKEIYHSEDTLESHLTYGNTHFASLHSILSKKYTVLKYTPYPITLLFTILLWLPMDSHPSLLTCTVDTVPYIRLYFLNISPFISRPCIWFSLCLK